MAAGAGARPAPRWLRALAEPLSAAQLRRLEEHRYSAAGVSVLEPPLQRYWAWLLQWVPLWLAPNSITLLGLVINLLTTLLLIAYCPTATEEVRRAPRGPPRPGGGRTPNCCPGRPRPPAGTAPAAGARGAGDPPPRVAEPPGPAEGGPRRFPPRRARPEPPRLPRGCHAATPVPRSRVRPEPGPGGAAEGLSRSRRAGGPLPAAPPPHATRGARRAVGYVTPTGGLTPHPGRRGLWSVR